jgi:hypothetical protein
LSRFRQFFLQGKIENGLSEKCRYRRQSTLDEELKQFPHVNGTLFKEQIRLPAFDAKMRQILIDVCSFDWSKVSPAIFGSLFQSVMDATKRRNLGAHYTSEKNILKVVRGLFLDELYAEFESLKNNVRLLRQFHSRLERLKFFDPACGCGNFLVITYREMRQLEIEILKQIRALSGNIQLELDASKLSVIDVDSFYGIEYEEFPAQIATVALWLTDHQANMALSAEFGKNYARLPLEKSANIHHANALHLDWQEVVSPEGNATETNLYILGNPPFVGGKMMKPEQRSEMAAVANDVPSYGLLDYVAAWYIRAAKFIENTRIKVAFVSTNSITQGEQVGVLWSYLLNKGVRIHFAHRTFRWNNEARGNAAVHCVIIGFATFDRPRKSLFEYESPEGDSLKIECKNINPYLIDAADLVISRRHTPLCDVPTMNFGNMPLDGGNLLIESDDELQEILNTSPQLERFIKKFTGAEEFINGGERWCLWFVNATPRELSELPPAIIRRIEAVRQFREASKAPSTRRFAETPSLFRDRNLQYLRQLGSRISNFPLMDTP